LLQHRKASSFCHPSNECYFSLSLFPKPEVFNFKLIYLNQQNFKKEKNKLNQLRLSLFSI
jgi:hypothetical protein